MAKIASRENSVRKQTNRSISLYICLKANMFYKADISFISANYDNKKDKTT